MPNEMSPATGSIIQAAGAVTSQGANSLFQFLTNKGTQRWNEKMYNKQRTDALSDWNRQNQYNSPDAQMQRLRDAGLNPNLVYGHGADAMSTSPVRSSSPGSYSPRAPQVDLGSVAQNALSTYYDMQIKKQTINNLVTQNDVLKNRAALDAVNAKASLAGIPVKEAEAANRNFDLFMKNQLAPGSLEIQQSQIENIQARTTATLDANERAQAMLAPNLKIAAQKILNMRIEALKNQSQTEYVKGQLDILGTKQYQMELQNRALEYDNMLREKGINPHSSGWLSTLGRLLEDTGAAERNQDFHNRNNIGVQGHFQK